MQSALVSNSSICLFGPQPLAGSGMSATTRVHNPPKNTGSGITMRHKMPVQAPLTPARHMRTSTVKMSYSRPTQASYLGLSSVGLGKQIGIETLGASQLSSRVSLQG